MFTMQPPDLPFSRLQVFALWGVWSWSFFFQIRIRAKITWSQHVHIYILPELRCLYLLPACAHLYVRIQVQASASLAPLKVYTWQWKPIGVCIFHTSQARPWGLYRQGLNMSGGLSSLLFIISPLGDAMFRSGAWSCCGNMTRGTRRSGR